jgi:hypothetical protein
MANLLASEGAFNEFIQRFKYSARLFAQYLTKGTRSEPVDGGPNHRGHSKNSKKEK